MSKYKHYILFTLIALLFLSVISYSKNGIQLGLDLKGGSVLTYRIDTPGGSVDIRTVGEYRIAMTGSDQSPRVELAVVRGYADLSTDRGTVAVTAGQRSIARLDAPPAVRPEDEGGKLNFKIYKY